MVNYQLGKIYKIVDNTNNNIYIGSTCEPTLSRRLATHLSDYKRYLEGKRGNVTSFQIFANNNYNIILIELYPCNSKDELHARERFYIESSLKCVNKQYPGRTKKEYCKIHKEDKKKYDAQYRIDNLERIKQTSIKYRNENKEKLYEKSKIKTLCICGQYRDNHKTRHENSKFHQNYINNLCTIQS